MQQLRVTASQWEAAWQRTKQRWQETCAAWDDPVRYQFEREFYRPLEAQVAATQRELLRLAQVIAHAHQSIEGS